jgi:transcriptional regulator with XRE-family HTH domain
MLQGSWTARAQAKKKDLRLTDGDLAVRLGERGFEVTRGAVNHWLNNKRPITLDAFFALCEILGADPGHLLFDYPVLPHILPPGLASTGVVSAPAPAPATNIPPPPSKPRAFKAARLKTRRK